jgi:3-phosphoshikimate 1-carboxyvinyltransferase
MNLLLQSAISDIQNTIKITGSKSETNRLLLLQALFPNITLANTSNSDDSEVMQKALDKDYQLPASDSQLVDIHHAGTAMRFLTAYFAVNEGREVVLTGSQRMTERPIKVLVEALRQLGAQITYEKEEGFPPIRIKGQKITSNKVTIPANVSSQYISALLLIAPKLENGIELTLEGEITSVPYIKMTLALLNDLNIKTSFEGNIIKVCPKQEVETKVMTVESDWSSASYFYSIVALANVGTAIQLSSYKENSLQGDSSLATIYKDLGVETTFENNSILLKKTSNTSLQILNCDLNSSPDIAQTIVVTCFGLGIGCHLTGLHTLKIKETDRLEALKTELTNLGANISVTDKSLTLVATNHINPKISIATYNDHRMAMAFAPLALKVPIIIDNAEVVSKSYPDFWEDMKSIGFQMTEK